MFSPDLFVRALELAARAHGDQKTPHGFPYLVHVCSVTMEVMACLRVEPGHDEDLAIACALLHDVLEDTPTPVSAVVARFGQRVADGVKALTKSPALPKAEAMRDSLERIQQQPPEIALVKLADRITNLAPPPPYWTADKIASYRAEAELIHTTLGSASPTLSQRLRERIAAYPPPSSA
jgi:(p)ppGpp synthase/HD superfamily hydrolase